MVSFVSYVLKFKNEANACGDVARDMLQDPNINRRWGFRKLVAYLTTTHRPSANVLTVLSDLNHRHYVNR
jgi:hypothetical protein